MWLVPVRPRTSRAAFLRSLAGAGISPRVRTRYSRCVKMWWPVGVAVAVALVIGLTGLVTGLLLARRSRRELVRTVDEIRAEERRAAAYLEAAIGGHASPQPRRPLAFREDGAAGRRPRDRAPVPRPRAHLELFGPRAV